METTVPSYYVSRSSRDVIVLAHQEITRIWWDRRLLLFDVYISPIVLEEIRRGNPEQANRRLQILSPFPVLEATTQVENLAEIYLRELDIPQRAMRDAAHLAFACAYGLDYLVTWNCAHIANAEIRRRLTAVNIRYGIETPVICTPEELMGREEI